ncbi:MAG: tetratricopeptide repeat protein [Pyrinomonadaceae bacterium]
MKQNLNIQMLVLALTIISLTGSVRSQTVESSARIALQAEESNNNGVDLLKAGEVAEAVKLFEKAIRLRANYTIAYGNLGAAFYRTGHSTKQLQF